MDHVSAHSSGPADAINASVSSQLGIAKPHPIADGAQHLVKIRYEPEIRYDLVSHFTATRNMLQYIKDNEESRRVGTLTIFVDDDETPLLAMPINLSALLALRDNAAYVGFTAATGKAWEKHDILAWYFCESPPCVHGDILKSDHAGGTATASNISAVENDEIDYHEEDEDNGNFNRTIPDGSTPSDNTHVP